MPDELTLEQATQEVQEALDRQMVEHPQATQFLWVHPHLGRSRLVGVATRGQRACVIAIPAQDYDGRKIASILGFDLNRRRQATAEDALRAVGNGRKR